MSNFFKSKWRRSVDQKLDAIKAILIDNNLKLQKTMLNLTDLQAKVTASVTVQDSAIALLQGLKKELDDAIAANDPAALQALSDSLGSETDKLATAVTANTPAAPAS